MMLAVTTRNKLRSPRFFLPMVRAWLLIRRQLRQTPGMVRYITGIANLTEFYTLTIWESRTAMFNFTGSDRHRQMMWMFTRWSESFWSMRWQPAGNELGAWDNLTLAERNTFAESDERLKGAGWLARSQVAELLDPYIDTVGRPDKRDLDPTACGVTAVLARVATRSPLEVNRLWREVRPWRSTPGLLRCTLGLGPGECLLISLWQADMAAEPTALIQFLGERFQNIWAMRFSAGDYEIGHWNHLRLRQLVAAHARPRHSEGTILSHKPAQRKENQ